VALPLGQQVSEKRSMLSLKYRMRVLAVMVLSPGITVFTASPAAGQDRRPAKLLGVYSSDGPLADAVVYDMLSGTSVRTTETGTAPLSFAQAQHDTIVIRIVKLGFRDTTFFTRVGPMDTLPVTIVLERFVALPTISVTALRSPMLERVRAYGGMQITAEELHKPEFQALSMQQILERTGINYMSLPPKGRGLPCKPILLVDGKAANSADLRTDTADTYEAVEYYPDRSFPIEFGTAGMRVCGLLLLWTRLPK
jgi:hypothetical protein